MINLPQDVASFASSLPRLPSEVDVIVVRKEGAHQSHRDFRVRRGVVHIALQWLVVNNKHYSANHVQFYFVLVSCMVSGLRIPFFLPSKHFLPTLEVEDKC